LVETLNPAQSTKGFVDFRYRNRRDKWTCACIDVAELVINVVDVNDERPGFELPVYIFDVEENQSAGVEVGVVSAVDRELSPFNQFTLSWRPSVEQFSIDSKTGVITTTQTLDHELQVL